MPLQKKGKPLRTPFEQGLLLAYRAIGRREYSAYEMSEYLVHKEVPPPACSEIIKKLLKDNYLNDERFTSAAIRDKKNLKNYGPHRIADFLKKKGIDSQMIEEKMAEEFDEQGMQEKEMMRSLLKRKRIAQNKSKQAIKQSLFGFLVRKGFEPSRIGEVIDEFLEEEKR